MNFEEDIRHSTSAVGPPWRPSTPTRKFEVGLVSKMCMSTLVYRGENTCQINSPLFIVYFSSLKVEFCFQKEHFSQRFWMKLGDIN